MATFLWIYLSAIAAATLAMISTSSGAGTVALELATGGLTIKGELLGFDGTTYTVRSESLGVISVDKGKFICSSGACPQKPDAVSSEPIASEEEPATTQSLSKDVRITGSSTIGGRLVPALIRDYAESLGGTVSESKKDDAHVVFAVTDKSGQQILSFDLKREGSSTAFPALKSGEADIGTSDRPISDQEVGEIALAGTEGMNRPEHEYVIGLDGIIVLSSPTSQIDSLSSEEIAGIFSGQITDWSELGYPPAKINVYATDEKSGTYRTFNSLVLRPFKRELTPVAQRFQSNEALAQAVAKDPGGIGFASFAEIGLARPVALRDPCGLSYMPSEFSVKTGEYPLSRNLYFYVRHPKKEVRDFLGFAASNAADAALKETGFIDKNLTITRFGSFRDRVIKSMNGPAGDFNLPLMQDLLATFENGARLSATMRFETGSSELDSESVQLLPDVVDYLKALPLNEVEVLITGFSDTSGPFESNKELSLKRAQAVKEALVLNSDVTIAPANLEVRGYGELFPAACNDTDEGRNKNRRVEIWLIPAPNASPSVLTKRL